MRKSLFLGFLLFLSASLFAQTKPSLSLSANFSTLSELRQGYKTILSLNDRPAFVVSQRSRLILDYKNNKLDLRFSLQDVRAWGETFIVNTTKPILLHEAWIRYKFNQNLNITIGRKAINYGDRRVFSDRNWSLSGAAHDVAILNFTKKNLYIDFGIAVNNNSAGLLVASPYTINQYQSMSWLWASKDFSPNFRLNFLNLLAAYQKTGSLTNYGVNTLGLNPVIKLFGFELNSAAYLQFGKNGNARKQQAHIYTANLKYAYQYLSLKVGYDHYSGKKYDDNSNTDYDFLQITETIPHSFLGYMDFVKGPQYQKQFGISDLNFNMKYGKKTSLAAYFHLLNYAHEPSAVLSKKIGKELDFLFTQKFGGQHTLNIGYSFMLPHDDFLSFAISPVTEAKFAQWVWVRLIFNPKLL
jgi:hypothetical protein